MFESRTVVGRVFVCQTLMRLPDGQQEQDLAEMTMLGVTFNLLLPAVTAGIDHAYGARYFPPAEDGRLKNANERMG